MNEPISSYARIGIVHHLLYFRCTVDPVYHAETLETFVKRPDMETFDCCLPYGTEYRQRLVKAVRESGKQHIAFATHLFPLRKLSFASPNYAEQAQCRLIVSDLISQAAEIGATGFIFASGGPPYAQGKQEHFEAFYDFCCWLCDQLAPHGITALLEPFDFDVDKAYLFGPLDKNIELVNRVRKTRPNIGIELDIAHLPIMREEIVDSIRRCGALIQRVHFGNCLLRDKSDPFYGDMHPPIGYRNGEIDVYQLVDAIRALLEVGFLNKESRGDLILEFNPFPGKTEEESVQDNLNRLQKAWALA